MATVVDGFLCTHIFLKGTSFLVACFTSLSKKISCRIISLAMTTTVDAIYEHGKILLPEPLSLPEKTRVRVTIESDLEREAWMKLSEETLMKTWGNDADDVFNELLKK
jgi:hypothetical protein